MITYTIAMLLWLAGLAGPPPAEEIPTPPDPPAISAPAGRVSVCQTVCHEVPAEDWSALPVEAH